MRIRTIITLLLIVAVLAACGGKPAATAVPTARPQNTAVSAQPTARPTAGAVQPTASSAQPTSAPEDYDLAESSSLDKLDSYRTTYSWRWSETKDGATKTGQWDAVEEYSKADAARHTLWSITDGGETTAIEIIRIGQFTYMKGEDGQWTSMMTTDSDPFASSAMFSDPLSGIAGDKGQLVQRGMSVNGVTADHYKLSESSGGFMGLGVADKMSGDVYVSSQLQVVVKYVAHYEGKTLGISGGTNGVLDVSFDLADINKPVKIVAPEGVAPPLSDDIPVIEGATELTAMSGVVSYKTTRTAAEVTVFYSEAMLAKGWTAGEGAIEGMLSFTKDERQATIMIQAESGVTSVTVIAAE